MGTQLSKLFLAAGSGATTGSAAIAGSEVPVIRGKVSLSSVSQRPAFSAFRIDK
jgi:hypothetical protein